MTLQKKLFGPFILSLSMALSNACAQGILVARVNGTGISQEQLERSFDEDLKQRKLNILQIRNPDRFKQMKRAVLDKLIEQELFWQQAKKAGAAASPQEVEQAYQSTRSQFKSDDGFEQRLLIEGYTPATYRLLVEQQVSATKYANQVAAQAAPVSDQEIHQFYQENPDKFHRPEQVRARHIMLKVAPDSSDDARAATRRRIEQLLTEVRAGADFGKLARMHSDAPTRQWDGEMEPFGRDQLPKPIEDAAFALTPGQASDVVTTPEGFHIIKIEDISAAVAISEEQAREKIRDFLQARAAKAAVDKEAERLRSASKVELLIPL